jgi:hypothetical protein
MTEIGEDFNQSALQKSIKKTGQLYPVLVNQEGEILDGNHRADGNPDAETKIIKTKNRYEALMVRGNAHYRRRVPQEETQQLILEMAQEAEKTGMPKEEIAQKIVEDLPYSQQYILRLIPAEYKSPQKAEQGSKRNDSSREKRESLANLVELDKRKGSGEHDLLVNALDTATYPKCPTCNQTPIAISSMGLPYVLCLGGHEWHLQKGSIMQTKQTLQEGETGSYLDRFAECSGCHLMLYMASLVDGKCPTCREREARQQKTPQKVAIDAELPVPVDVDAEIREALGQPEAPKSSEMEIPAAQQAWLSSQEITFLIKLPPTIMVTKEQLTQFFIERDYDETGLKKRIVTQTADGLTVTFSIIEWMQSNIEDGAPSGAKHSSIFRDELISILEGEPTCNIDELEKITIQQIGAASETEKPQKPMKEIDFEHIGKSCPCCLRPLTEEGYERCEKRLGGKYPALFGTEPTQKTIKCECGQEILILPDIAEMSKAIEEHARNNCSFTKDAGLITKQTIILHLTQDLLLAIAGSQEASA